MAKRETNAQKVESILKWSSDAQLAATKFVASKGKETKQELSKCFSELERLLRRSPPALKDLGVQRALRELERAFTKIRSVFRAYKRTSLFTSADLFADMIKIRRLNKAELTPLDMAHFQQAFCEFRENFPEFLRLVADLLEEKPLRMRADRYGYDSAIKAAYKEAFKRCNAWFFEADQGYKLAPCDYLENAQKFLATGVMPTFAEFKRIFREQNPKIRGDSDPFIDPSLQGAPDRSLRRSLQRLGLVVLSDKRGRPRKK
jgi:hypothetical protein